MGSLLASSLLQSRVTRFFLTTYQNWVKYTKVPQHYQNGLKINQMTVIHIFQIANNTPTFSISRPSKITQVGIFGLKIYHLATLLQACFNACKLLLPKLAWITTEEAKSQSYDLELQRHG
jgi:hypothetical protein